MYPVIEGEHKYDGDHFYEKIPLVKPYKNSYTVDGTPLRPLNTFVICGITGPSYMRGIPGTNYIEYINVNAAVEYTIECGRLKFWIGPHWLSVLVFLKSEKKRILSNLYVSFPECRFMLRKEVYISDRHLTLYVFIE